MPDCCDRIEVIDEVTEVTVIDETSEAVVQDGVPGPSSYDLALQMGYTGTLSEWLSLITLPVASATTLSSNCLVAINALGNLIRADASDSIPAHGLVREATEAGFSALVTTSGRINGFSGLTPGGTVWLGESGQITQTAPTAGILQEIGYALTADSIMLSIQSFITFS